MKRTLLALLISSLGIALSFYYLRPKEWSQEAGLNKSTIARVLETKNDVNRQEAGKLLWAPLRKGDSIHLGDKIKTSSLSSVALNLTESTGRLEIEENSTVLMSGIGKKLTLNMLEGRLFLKQAEEVAEANKVDLVSGGKKLDIQGDAAVSVSKDGTSLVENFKPLKENPFQELEPAYGQSFLSSGAIDLKWRPDQQEAEVFVESGVSAAVMMRAPVSSKLASGKLKMNFTPGTVYWRLVTKLSDEEVKSSLMKLTIEKPLSPILLYPASGDVIKIEERGFDFKWTRGNISDVNVLEISRDALFSKVFESTEVKNQTFYKAKKSFDEAPYFWRLKSKLPDGSMLITKGTTFNMIKGVKYLSPLPVEPVDGAIFYKGLSQNVMFKWKSQAEGKSFELTIEGHEGPKVSLLTQNETQMNVSKLGQYSWSVISQMPDGSVSTLPFKRTFELREFEKLTWLNPQNSFHYLETFPIIILKWSKPRAPRVTLLISEAPTMLNPQSFSITGLDFPYRPSRDGVHYAQLFLKDELGQVAGESPIFEFTVGKAPLPPIPEFDLPSTSLMASTRGDVAFKLKNHSPNLNIVVRLLNSRGAVVDERRFSENAIRFSSLLPGKYAFQANFEDDYKRSGEVSPRLALTVPEKSMIAAPKIKGIKVR